MRCRIPILATGLLSWLMAALVGAAAAEAQTARDALLDSLSSLSVGQNDRSQELLGRLASEPSKRVFGPDAREVPTGYFKETVALEVRKRTRCSGVLVTADAVLTAAHCVCDLGYHLLPADGNGKLIDGSIKIGSGTRVRVDWATTYQTDYCSNGRRGLDIGLVLLHPREAALRLKLRAVGQVRFDSEPEFSAARLAPTFLLLSRQHNAMTVVGYGISNGNNIGQKFYAPVPIASRICGSPMARAYFNCRAGAEMVLAGQGADTCSGDSGGPAFIILGNEYYLAGVTSRALDPGGRCGPGGVYTLITPRIVNWLRSQLGRRVVAFE